MTREATWCRYPAPRTLIALALALGLLAARPARAAVPGITGTAFGLVASADNISQPDGAAIYSWGYGCDPAAAAPTFLPFAGSCPQMQLPGPTLIVTEGQTITVTLRNNLPPAAGNTSIVFPGFTVAATGGVSGLLAQEAAPGGTVTYTLTGGTPGTCTTPSQAKVETLSSSSRRARSTSRATAAGSPQRAAIWARA